MRHGHGQAPAGRLALCVRWLRGQAFATPAAATAHPSAFAGAPAPQPRPWCRPAPSAAPARLWWQSIICNHAASRLLCSPSSLLYPNSPTLTRSACARVCGGYGGGRGGRGGGGAHGSCCLAPSTWEGGTWGPGHMRLGRIIMHAFGHVTSLVRWVKNGTQSGSGRAGRAAVQMGLQMGF